MRVSRARSDSFFATAAGSPLQNAIAVGPVSMSARPSLPARSAAMRASVFFETRNVASSGRRPVRTDVIAPTDNPR